MVVDVGICLVCGFISASFLTRWVVVRVQGENIRKEIVALKFLGLDDNDEEEEGGKDCRLNGEERKREQEKGGAERKLEAYGQAKQRECSVSGVQTPVFLQTTRVESRSRC